MGCRGWDVGGRTAAFRPRPPTSDIRPPLQFRLIHLLIKTPRLGANVAEHEVNRDAVDPTRERGVAAPRVELLPHGHEDVLRQLRRACAGAAHAKTEREHPWRVRAIELFEGGFIT